MEWLSSDIPDEVRLKIAQGLIPLKEQEFLDALVTLLSDKEPRIREESKRSIKRYWELLSPHFHELSSDRLDLLERAFSDEPEIVEWLNRVRRYPRPKEDEEETHKERGFTKELFQEKDVYTDAERSNIYKKILGMKVVDKIKLALMGNREVRAILIKDSNKMVATTVLKNPRLTVEEVAKIVQSRNVSDDVLRIIANTKEWLKDYHVKLALVNNPKTPVGVSIRLLMSLKKKDLQNLSRSKNIPVAVATAAKRLMAKKGV